MPRNIVLPLAGVAVALVTLLVSSRFGFVFFLLPLFFYWSRGGGERGGEDAAAVGTNALGETGVEEPNAGEDDRDDGRRDGPGRRPPERSGLDGERI